jgi:hypothetical protein
MALKSLRCAAFTLGILLITRPVVAGFAIDVYVDNIIAYQVVDNGLGDNNPALGDIEHHFLLSDAMNRWGADGVIFAEGGYNGVPPVSTVVTDTLIEKIANVPLNIGEIDFVHHYAASGLQSHTASIDGVFDNTIDHEVRGASLQYLADINGQSLGAFATGLYAGPGPWGFMGGLGPLILPTTTEHHMELRFYLDSLGDSIQMFNSAEIHTTPEPAGAVLIWALGVIIASRRGNPFVV